MDSSDHIDMPCKIAVRDRVSVTVFVVVDQKIIVANRIAMASAVMSAIMR